MGGLAETTPDKDRDHGVSLTENGSLTTEEKKIPQQGDMREGGEVGRPLQSDVETSRNSGQ